MRVDWCSHEALHYSRVLLRNSTLAFTTITGASGAPTTYTGTDGVDLITLVNPGATDLRADGADDFIGVNFTAATGTATSVSLRGGQGIDTFQFTGVAGGTLVSSFIAGNLGNDQMFTTGTGALLTSSTVQGGQGNDAITIAGTNGGSLINGNLGDDTLLLTAGTFTSSSIFGGQGNDSITTTNASVIAGVSIDGAIGNDTITLGTLAAGSNGITLSGGSGDDVINAAAVNTAVALYIDGGIGNDTLTDGSGNSTINGGEGLDFITGGAGNDTVTGGAGPDRFILLAGANATAGAVNTANGIDVITDFSILEDTISLSGLLANAIAFQQVVVGTTTASVANVMVATPNQTSGGVALGAADVDLMNAGLQGTNDQRGFTIFSNNGVVQLWYDADLDTANGAADVTLVATLSNLAAAQLTQITAGNFV